MRGEDGKVAFKGARMDK